MGANTMDVHILPSSVSLGILLYRLRNSGFAALRRAFQRRDTGISRLKQWGLLVRLRRQEGVNQNQLPKRRSKIVTISPVFFFPWKSTAMSSGNLMKTISVPIAFF